MELEVSEEEGAVLREVLDSAYRDLSPEIADTDNPEYRRDLKARRDSILRILSELGGPLPDAAR